jgi:hypothetical protein
MIAWIGALSTFVGREQDAHKREEREEADGAGEQHVVFLQIIRTSFARLGSPHRAELGSSGSSEAM